MRMPEPDQTALAKREQVVARLRSDRAGRGRDRRSGRAARLRVRWPVRLSRGAHGGGPAEHHGAGLRDPEAVRRGADQGGAARCRHLALGRRLAADRRHRAGSGQVQPHPGDRLREPLRGRPAGRHQSRHHPCGRARRLLLRARSVQPDRVHDRRQRRRELGRRALPEVRAHHQQHSRPRDGPAERRRGAPRRQAPGRRGLRPARPDDRLRGALGRGHRGHRAHPEEARVRARHAHGLSEQRAGGRLRRRDHRATASSRAASR